MSNAKRVVVRKVVADSYGNIEGATPLESFPLGNLKNGGRGKKSSRSTFSEHSAAHKDFEKNLFGKTDPPPSLEEEFLRTVVPAFAQAYVGLRAHVVALAGITKSTVSSTRAGVEGILEATKSFVGIVWERKGI